MLHDAPAARELPQALLPVPSAKSLGLAPAIVIPVIVNAALPLFVSVTVVGALVVPDVALAKVTGLGANVTAGAGGGVPVPVRVEVCGDPAALSATCNVAEKPLADAGVNVT